MMSNSWAYPALSTISMLIWLLVLLGVQIFIVVGLSYRLDYFGLWSDLYKVLDYVAYYQLDQTFIHHCVHIERVTSIIMIVTGTVQLMPSARVYLFRYHRSIGLMYLLSVFLLTINTFYMLLAEFYTYNLFNRILFAMAEFYLGVSFLLMVWSIATNSHNHGAIMMSNYLGAPSFLIQVLFMTAFNKFDPSQVWDYAMGASMLGGILTGVVLYKINKFDFMAAWTKDARAGGPFEQIFRFLTETMSTSKTVAKTHTLKTSTPKDASSANVVVDSMKPGDTELTVHMSVNSGTSTQQ